MYAHVCYEHHVIGREILRERDIIRRPSPFERDFGILERFFITKNGKVVIQYQRFFGHADMLF